MGGFNGSGIYSRFFSWATDSANNINITDTRMDTEDNGFAAGLSTAICKDGQTTLTADIPFSTHKITGLGDGVSAQDAATLKQVQAGQIQWAVAGGTADALTGTYSPAHALLTDGLLCFVRATAGNATTTPTFSPDLLTAHTVTKLGGTAVVIGEWANLQELALRYNLANTRWELQNPRKVAAADVTGNVVNSIADATNGGLAFSGATGTITANIAPSDLLTKATPTTSDSLVIMDAANSNKASTATIPKVMAALFSPITNSLSGDVALNNTANFFDGPSIAQGTTGTWFVSGTVTLVDTLGAADFTAKLWDGTTVIAATRVTLPAVGGAADGSISLSGFIASPAANLRISVKDITSTSGVIRFNISGTSKDSTITAIRIA